VGVQSTKVKICGVARLDDAVLAAELGAWAVGMVFYAPSPRSCPPEEAEAIAATLKRRVQLAGVFVNASLDEIGRLADQLALTLIQLHGDEGPSFCSEVARRTGARVIKASPIAGPGALQDLERFHTDFHLLDGHTPGLRGGGGETFEWELLAGRRSKIPAILSGGLTPENVRSAIDLAKPYAVDVASGVESSPGVKDDAKLRAFFAAVHPPQSPDPLDPLDPLYSRDPPEDHEAAPAPERTPAERGPNDPDPTPAEALA
jgi:phosphoribosylanthranilate isomerase